jgi:hypothetical protein
VTTPLPPEPDIVPRSHALAAARSGRAARPQRGAAPGRALGGGPRLEAAACAHANDGSSHKRFVFGVNRDHPLARHIVIYSEDIKEEFHAKFEPSWSDRKSVELIGVGLSDESDSRISPRCAWRVCRRQARVQEQDRTRTSPQRLTSRLGGVRTPPNARQLGLGSQDPPPTLVEQAWGGARRPRRPLPVGAARGSNRQPAAGDDS